MLLHQGFSGSLRHRCVSADELSVCQEGIEEGEGDRGVDGRETAKTSREKAGEGEKERDRGVAASETLITE